MSSFWPKGVEITDTQSPREILSTAQEDWQTKSDGVMELILQDTQSESGNSMIIVHAKYVPSNRTATLFSRQWILSAKYFAIWRSHRMLYCPKDIQDKRSVTHQFKCSIKVIAQLDK